MALDPITAGLEAGQGVLSLVTGVIDRIWPDPAQASQAKLQVLQMQQTGELDRLRLQAGLVQAQLDVNRVEAASPSLLVSGWRPAIGWVCAAALAFQYIVRPLAGAALSAAHVPVTIPGLDDTMWQLMFGILGFGGLRTYEKTRGVAS
jgi:hypothetical protein